MEHLLQDLQTHSLEEQLAALCDGEFLSQYEVTEAEIEGLFWDLKETESAGHR